MEVYRDTGLGTVGGLELPFAFYATNTPAIGNAAWGPYVDLPLASVVPGDNVVAVQLKQFGTFNQDIYMAIELVAELAETRPSLCIFREGEQVRIVWPCPSGAASAAGYALKGADDIRGPWGAIAGAASPYVVSATDARKFYLLVRE
jgi:hypothetical protein